MALETGLLLPIRMYDSKIEQDRYKPQSEGVALLDELFVHVDWNSLAPFQITKFMDYPLGVISWKIICVGTLEETELPYTLGCWEDYIDDQDAEWISYLGNDNFNGILNNGRYWIEVSVTDAEPFTKIYYSDIFVISNAQEEIYDNAEYLTHTNSINDKIKIDTTDLLIIKP